MEFQTQLLGPYHNGLRAMYGPPAPLRLLVFDAGDIHVISQLLILDQFLSRLEWKEGLESRLHPCDYFHMMVGVGSSGIIVIFLVKLRMSIEETIEEFIKLWKCIFDDAFMDPAKRSQKLEKYMKDLLKERNVKEDVEFFEDDPITSRCSAFICLGSRASVTLCRKIRTYRSPEKRIDITILDAVRATCATPMFLPVRVGPKSLQLELISGELGFSNPVREAITEAHQLYGAGYKVSCVLSLGSGRPISTPEDPRRELGIKESLSWNAAVASKKTAEETERQISTSKVYHRFSVDRELRSYEGIPLDPGVIEARTASYLAEPKVSKELDACVDVSLGGAQCVLDNIYRSPSRKFAPTQGIPPLCGPFVPRNVLMDKIHDKLRYQRCLVLSGMSGIGKTQIVSSFLRNSDHGYGPILFLDASSNRSIEAGLIKRVSSFGVEYRCAKVEEALDKLAQPDQIIRNWIIIFDNANDADIDLPRYFPECDEGVIIITTQNPFFGKLAPSGHIALDLMTEVESVEVLLKSADLKHSTENVGQAKAIVVELGYLPVAIVQAGDFIRIHRCISDYVNRLRENRPNILKRYATIQTDRHYHGIYTALDVTWEKLSPHAQGLMSILAFTKYTDFPRTLFYIAGSLGFQYEAFNFIGRPQEFLQTIILLREIFHLKARWNKQDVDDIVKELEQYSLITLVDNSSDNITLRLHPLVQNFAYDRLESHQRAMYQAAALRLLVCGSGEENQALYELISPHIPLLHTLLASVHANDLAGIARIFYYEGRISEATQIWENIRDQVVLEYKEDHLRTSEARLQLAKMYWESNDWRKWITARIWEDRVVEFRLDSLPDDDPAIARAMSQQARGLEYSYRLPEAERVRVGVLKRWEEHFEPNSEEVLQEKENLAQNYQLGERWIDAQKLWIEIWEVRKVTNGSGHWRTLRVMESLANLYTMYGFTTNEGASGHRTNVDPEQDKRAEMLWQEVIARRTETRGDAHPDTLYALQSLAWCFEMQHRDEEAEELWKRIFEVRERIQGDDHEATWQARNALAFFDYKQKRYEDAAEKWQTTIEASERVGRTKSRQSAKAMKSLARLYEKTGRVEEASHLDDKLKSMPSTRDHEIRTRYQRAVAMLDREHKRGSNQHAQPARTGRDVQKARETTAGVRPGHVSRPDDSPYSSRQKSQSDTQTSSSRGTLIPAELQGLRYHSRFIADSPLHIQALRSALRSPDITSVHKTPEVPANALLNDLPTIVEPPDVTNDGYFHSKPLTHDDGLDDCHDEEAAQWKNDRDSMERLLLPNTLRSDRDEAPQAPHPTPALPKDDALPIVANLITVTGASSSIRVGLEADIQASCLQSFTFVVKRLVSKAKRLPLRITRRKSRAHTTKP